MVLDDQDLFDMLIVHMGQGDCCIIRCPDDKVVIVDCGSSAKLDYDSFEFANKKLIEWAKGHPVHAVILTHPDKDHYNQLLDLLFDEVGNDYLKVKNIYFSLKSGEKSPLGRYTNKAKLGSTIANGVLGKPKLYEVTINPLGANMKRWRIDKVLYQKSEDVSISSSIPPMHTVHKGNTLTYNRPWKISIVAGNVGVNAKGEAPSDVNTASLVTLVECGKKKILLTGDATKETQKYLTDIFYDPGRNELKNISMLQIPHHGSDLCESKDKFMDMVTPERLYVSVALMENMFNLPRYGVIHKWLSRASVLTKSTGEAIHLDCWKDKRDKTVTFIHTEIEAVSKFWDGEHYSFDPNPYYKGATTCYLTDWKDASKTKSSGFYCVSSRNHVLYREVVDKMIWETGANQELLMELSEGGVKWTYKSSEI